MCGIFGFVGKSSWKTSALLQSLCIADEVRGKDSTGLVIQTNDGCVFRKKALPGHRFVSEGYTDILFKNEYTAAMGHNRQATTGRITDRNAHPYSVRVGKGWCFGIHNGIIRNKKEIAQLYDIKEPEVDSEVVFWSLARLLNEGMPLIDAIVDITKNINQEGDYALGYLDTSEREIYLWRNIARPIVILDARKLGLGRWFASTKEVFSQAWDSIRGALGPISDVTYFDVKPHRLYQMTKSGNVETVTDIKVPGRFYRSPDPIQDWRLPDDELAANQADLFPK